MGPSAGVVVVVVVVYHKLRQSCISRTVSARIITDLSYICTGYGVIIYFRSEATAKKKPSKMPPYTASGVISREKFMRGSPNFTRLSGTNVHKNLPDMTSLISSGRLQNAIEYWTKVMRKTGTAGQRVK